MKKILFLSFLCFFIFSLISCSKVEETSKPPFDYLRAFGGISKEERSRIFPLKDGTFYVVTDTFSPASNGDIPKSMHLKYHDFIQDVFNFNANERFEKSDIWLFQIDPNKPYNKQIIYSRCFGGSGEEELWSACLDENENIIIGAKTTSKDGDVKADNNERNSWIFRVEPKKPYKEQITYSQTFPQSYMWIPLDIKSIDKDKCYLLYNTKGNEDYTYFYSLMKFDFSKEVEKNPAFDKKIFFTNSARSFRSWIVVPHISISDKGIITMTWMMEKDKIFSPFKEDEPLNIDRNVDYKEHIDESNPLNIMDILVLSLDPKLPEKDWIVYSRIIGGSKSDAYPQILKAENESFWISFFTGSEDGDMKDNVINMTSNDYFYQGSLAIMKVNPTLSKDKQIEYVKFIQADRACIKSPYSHFDVCGDKLGFLFGIKNLDSNDMKIKKVNLTENQKKKNITLPYLEVEEFFEKPGYCKFFALDTKTDKCYFNDFKVSVNGIFFSPYVSFSDSSLYFSIDSDCPPKFGDMPNYKVAAFESGFSTDILIGKIDIKNMKELSNDEKK